MSWLLIIQRLLVGSSIMLASRLPFFNHIKLISSVLANRFIVVIVNKSTSSISINRDARQAILSPTLFFLFKDDPSINYPVISMLIHHFL